MKYKKHRILYKCALCNVHTVTLHELVPGRGNKDVCVKFNIQLPLCVECHKLAHSDVAKEIRSRLFSELCVDEFKAVRGVHTKKARWYLYEIKDHCAEKIKSMEA